MKRTPLKRKTPLRRGKSTLRRKTRLRARSKTNSYRKRERDIAYMLTVKRLPCAVRAWVDALLLARLHPRTTLEPALQDLFEPFDDLFGLPTPTKCWGRVQADHAGARGLGVKCPDDQCTPLCELHHRERTEYKGTFRWFTAVEMRAWNDWAIARTQAEVAELRRVIAEIPDICAEAP